MLKVLVSSSLKRVAWRKMQTAAVPPQHCLPSGLHNPCGSHEKTREGVAMPTPVEHYWNPRSHFSTKKKDKKKVGGGWHFPTTVREKRIAVEVMETISQALQQGPCYNPVLKRCGFQILKVKMSSDLRTAHVLWTALPGMQTSAEKAAISRVNQLRSLVFKRLNLPFSPNIKFQEDKASKEMLALEQAFAKLKEEEVEGQTLKESKGEGQKLKESDGEDHKPSESEGEDQNKNVGELNKEISYIAPS